MPPFARLSDAQLLAAARAGDGEAFSAFYRRHNLAVLRYIRRRVGSAHDAADLTAETFAAAVVSLRRGHASEIPDGAAWLCGIARHKIIDSYRAGRLEEAARSELRLERIDPDDADIDAINELDAGDSPVQRALDLLSEPERQAVIERVVLEREYGDIAERTNSSETAIRKRVSRALARLRQEIGESE